MADTELSIAQRQLAHGSKYPYDGGDDAAPAIDWAHAAARGVLADLLDRRGVKWELEKVDLDVRADIVTAVAAIVRAAAPSPSTAPEVDERAASEAGARIAESYGPSRPIVAARPSDLIRGRWEGEQAASANIARLIRERAALASRPAEVDAVRLLREARAVLETWKDVAPAVSLCADIDKVLAGDGR